MKKTKMFIYFLLLALIVLNVSPVNAQLGTTDKSSFAVQNISDSTATVTISFITTTGSVITPPELNSGKPNPFDLPAGASWEVYVPGIPNLDDGQYSVMISSTQKIVAIANLVGEGINNFNGSYSGFESGAQTFYLPAVVYNYYGWYSLLSVQNVGTASTNVTVTITCSDGLVGTLTALNVPMSGSVHFDLEKTVPTGFLASTKCNGSAVVTSSGQPITAVDNQTVPTAGNTQSYSGTASGATSLYVPALYKSYYGWNASLNIRKLAAGNTTVTVTYSDSGSSTCNLTDLKPSCLLYIPTEHAGNGYFGATITTSPTMNILSVVNAANGAQAQTYNAINSANTTAAVSIPSVMKSYYGWNTSFTCQNVGTAATTLRVEYNGFSGNAYNTISISPGKTIEVVQSAEAFLPFGYQGGLNVTANTTSALISCIVNFNNATQMRTTTGDWSMSVNAFSK
jgi:hypothetical protein